MKRPCSQCWLFTVSALALGWNLGQITTQYTTPPPPVVVLPQELPPPPVAIAPEAPVPPLPPPPSLSVKICTLSGAIARSRCPVTREPIGADVDRKDHCILHIKVCPVDGKPQSFIDPQTEEERVFCVDHGAKLVDID
jgi:hypothetical protein